jgi:hypothetical protein
MISPTTVVFILVLLAGMLAAIHHYTCDQDLSKTSKCDVAFGVPIIVLLATACGICGLAILASGSPAKK